MQLGTSVTVISTQRQVVVEEGDKYQFLYDVSCRDGSVQPKGSVLTVVKRTGFIPYGEVGPRGFNWLCDAVNGRTVWSTLESCIDRGLLRKL